MHQQSKAPLAVTPVNTWYDPVYTIEEHTIWYKLNKRKFGPFDHFSISFLLYFQPDAVALTTLASLQLDKIGQ